MKLCIDQLGRTLVLLEAVACASSGVTTDSGGGAGGVVFSTGGSTPASGGVATSTGGSTAATCQQGDTRACVGPGACAGGQVCQPAGTWASCDCGSLSSGGAAAGGAASSGGSAVSGGTNTGGSAGPTPQPCALVPMPNSHISDFSVWNSGSWGAQGDLTGGQSLYQSDASAAFTPSVDVGAANPSLHLTAAVPSSGYAGYVMWFPACMDASVYSGIRFQISGTLGGGTLDFQVQTNDNYPIDRVNLKGACAGGSWSQTSCWNNHAPVTVTAASTTVAYPWAELTGGHPISPVDPQQLLGIQWQANCTTTTACFIDLNLDTIELF